MRRIPFFANLEDGTHCYQAALKMVLTFFTHKEWSFEKLDALSGKLAGKWTWPTTSLLWLLDHDFEVKLVEEFSFEEFAKRGKGYLVEKCGSEVANAQESNSDLPREQELAAKLSKRLTVDYRVPTWDDLKYLLNNDYLIICNINSYKISRQPGYAGHFVVPVEIFSESVFIHDPGLPPRPSLEVKRTLFEEAWGYPTGNDKNLLAIRPRPKEIKS